MTREVFGVAASPYLLLAIVKRHLNEHSAKMRRTTDRLKRDIYCDDLLTSLRTEREASTFVHEAKEAFRSAGMNLTKWSSNRCMNLDTALPTADQRIAPGILLMASETDQTKVLGVRWLCQEDELYFHGRDLYDLGIDVRSTKRNILQISARIYDPLGLISAFTARAKMLLKELWILGLGWDEELPPTVRRRWLQWLHELKSLESLRIPRPCAY